MFKLLDEVPSIGIVSVDYLLKFCMIVGLMSLRRSALRLLRTLYYMVRPAVNFKEKYGTGSWAVVTGASDGIGRGFCE